MAVIFKWNVLVENVVIYSKVRMRCSFMWHIDTNKESKLHSSVICAKWFLRQDNCSESTWIQCIFVPSAREKSAIHVYLGDRNQRKKSFASFFLPESGLEIIYYKKRYFGTNRRERKRRSWLPLYLFWSFIVFAFITLRQVDLLVQINYLVNNLQSFYSHNYS